MNDTSISRSNSSPKYGNVSSSSLNETETDWDIEKLVGVRGLLASELAKLKITPVELKQKGASYAATILLEQLPFNFGNLFTELDQFNTEI